MKKAALCVFVMIFWLVGACTFLSIKVEEEMIPQVTTREAQMSLSGGQSTLPGDCLQEDEMGMHLYSIYEGTGWEEGTRVSEESGYTFDPESGDLLLDNSWGDFVQYASKPLRLGELVEVVRAGSTEEDRWLAVFPEGRPENWELPDGVTVEEEGGSAVQFIVEKAQQPFMPGLAKSKIPQLKEARVYSFADMNCLLENFHNLSLLLGVLAAALVLWLCSCGLARNAKQSRWFLLLNLALGALLLVLVPVLLSGIDLPSSLLPREQITDLGYIAGEMDEFFGALTGFAPEEKIQMGSALPQSQAGGAIMMAKNHLVARPLMYTFLGALFSALIALVERIAIYHKHRPRVK